ncbi:MAG: hypothetical protein FJX95_07635 [Bacteroidetes bacterium]|nr:hypothetical protein [Bacteroidota bacterium]
MKNVGLIIGLFFSLGSFAQGNYELTWCDRNMDTQSEIKLEMSCLMSNPTIRDEDGEVLTVKNYRLSFAEGDLVVQTVRNAEEKLDQRIIGILKQSTGFAAGTLYDLVVIDSKGKVRRIDQAYKFMLTK